jgi:hypothetical protein
MTDHSSRAALVERLNAWRENLVRVAVSSGQAGDLAGKRYAETSVAVLREAADALVAPPEPCQHELTKESQTTPTHIPVGFVVAETGIHRGMVRQRDGLGLVELHEAGECPRDCSICATAPPEVPSHG